MRFCKSQAKRQNKRLISTLLLGSLLLPGLPVLAEDSFGGDWQPKPLVDTTAPPVEKAQPQATAAPQQAPPPVQPDLEAKLKPVEPFIREVENRLTLKPKPGVPMVQRLNTLQTVLFGEQKYQDAGELITKLAEVFPQEAQKAQAELEKQFQDAMQASASAQAGQAAKAVSGKSIGKSAMVQDAGQGYRPNQTATVRQVPKVASPKKRHFWNTDDFGSDFDNDPFFRDMYQGRVKTSAPSRFTQGGMTSQITSSNNGFSQSNTQSYGSPSYNQQPYGAQAQQSMGPSRLASIAQGLGGLALAVGGLAGAYYLNNKMPGGNQGYGNNYGPYANNGYGYGPNGVNPYGVSPHGMNPYNISPDGAGRPYTYGGVTYGLPTALGNGAVMSPYTALSPYKVAPYVSPSYNSAIPYGTGGQTYNYSPYGVGSPGYQSYSGSGFSGSTFGIPGF